MEEWQEIINFPNYSVSNFGNVKNNIWGVINNLKKTSGGFIWKYLD